MFSIFKKTKKYYRKKITVKVTTSKKKPLWKKHSKHAHTFVTSKILEINNRHGKRFMYRRISIRNQKTRWGSCSSNGNLNFNYKIIFLPDYLAEYLIIHELCHLVHLDHSKNFWNLVGEMFPDYKKAQKELKAFRIDSRKINYLVTSISSDNSAFGASTVNLFAGPVDDIR